MTIDEVFCNTFKAIGKQIAAETRKRVDFMLPSMPMVQACRADDFDFFHSLIEAGTLTQAQMQHAAKRYYLGKTRSGKPIFWMIDDMTQPLDAHIDEGWISTILKQREPLIEHWPVRHCLFGEHLTHMSLTPICIVESELTAVILSELLPDTIWMAYAHTTNLTPFLLAPLVGRNVTIYPRTDPTMSNYVFFLDYAALVRKHYNINLHISSTLEYNTTAEQKERCIDILDFILDKSTSIQPST